MDSDTFIRTLALALALLSARRRCLPDIWEQMRPAKREGA